MFAFLVPTVAVLCLTGCQGKSGGGGAIAINISASPTSIVSGTDSTLTVTITNNGGPAADAPVEITASGCGTLNSAPTKTDSLGDVPTFTFTGTSPQSTCTATIKINALTQSKSCTVTVTPIPITQPINVSSIPGAPSSGTPEVSITPDAKVTKGQFVGTYTISSSTGFPLQYVTIEVEHQSDITSSGGTMAKNPSKGVTSARANYSNDPTSDTITITSDDGKPMSTADFHVVVTDGVGGAKQHLNFSAVGLPKGTPAQAPLPGPGK
jgi:hypothetical protein